jgi:hypothetical protein
MTSAAVKLYTGGYFKSGDSVLCAPTSNGLRDPDTVFKVSRKPSKVKGELAAVEDVIRDIL